MTTQISSLHVKEQLRSRPASDGDGVRLMRVFGGHQAERFDPFLMMDEFGSDQASDYIGGFPPHPHRGFETITYMLQGKMEHRDHMGNVGLLNDGDVQWMTAGKGVIHSEMPKQTEGKMRGFQVWLNLPAEKKMAPARYEDVPGEGIPSYQLQGVMVKAIAGKTKIKDQGISGYFDVPDTEALYLDLHLNPDAETSVMLNNNHRAMVYTYDGNVTIGSERAEARAGTMSRLQGQGELTIHNNSPEVSRVIILAGKPLNEPIVQHGPFVMNTTEEIDQAIRDYQQGVLTD